MPRLDAFDPTAELVPVAERPEIDRWLLSNLQALTATTNREFAEFDAAEVCRAAAGFIDDLSNWYIRRNRRRFWRSRDAGDRDKLAAYQTLYHALLELTKLLAPLDSVSHRADVSQLAHGGSRERASVRLSAAGCDAARPGTE